MIELNGKDFEIALNTLYEFKVVANLLLRRNGKAQATCSSDKIRLPSHVSKAMLWHCRTLKVRIDSTLEIYVEDKDQEELMRKQIAWAKLKGTE